MDVDRRTSRTSDAGAPVETPARPALAVFPEIELLDYETVPGTAADGPGSLLLLHGWAEPRGRLRFVGDALCPRGHAAVYPSLRGHGASPAPVWGYSPLEFAADLQRIADALPPGLHVVGFSFGALVGVLSAATWGVGRIDSVVVLDQSFCAQPERHEQDPGTTAIDVESGQLRWWFDYTPCLDVLDLLGIPVLVVVAEDSHVVPAAERAALAARAGRRFAFARIPGTHTGSLDDEERIVRLLTGFYADRVQGAGAAE